MESKEGDKTNGNTSNEDLIPEEQGISIRTCGEDTRQIVLKPSESSPITPAINSRVERNKSVSAEHHSDQGRVSEKETGCRSTSGGVVESRGKGRVEITFPEVETIDALLENPEGEFSTVGKRPPSRLRKKKKPNRR
ncbi:hypothetical protein NE237_029967 [Protea cynaroides]|uniref:Uncharacterized protein n=1 Tax=Protea cynaroides TaxID=273540 RepID=A0A9Q0JWJ8_9MAGN|nr:hypothetical protein NE237_029967 [Protea cynaroides]